MLGSAINSALQGLRAASRRTELASRNITGATQEGYVRKEALIDSGAFGLVHRGTLRSTDLAVFSQTTRERAQLSGMEAELTARTALVAEIGDPRDGTDLGSLLTELEEGITRLSGRPEDATLQLDVVGKASAVTAKMNDLGARVQAERLTADTAIASSVDEVNAQIAAIHDLNRQIVSFPERTDATELMDARERAVAALTEHLPVRTYPRADGQWTVVTREGVTLVDDAVHELSFTGTQTMAPSLDYAGGSGTLSGLVVDGQDITPASGAPQAPRAGLLQGLFKVRDEAMPEAQAQLDELASMLAWTFQNADSTITAPTTQAGLFTDGGVPHDRSDPAAIRGLANRIAVNAVVDPDQGGDSWRLRTGLHATSEGNVGESAQLRAFAEVLTDQQSFAAAAGLGTSVTIATFASQLTGYQGTRSADLENERNYQSSLVASLDARLTERQGVDLDKELQDILLFEHSYSASASVLQSAQRMLDELLQSTRN